MSSRLNPYLRARGYDAIAISERAAWVGMSDPDIVELARGEQRAIVTSTLRDFRTLAAQALTSDRGHAGMIFVPTTYRRNRKDSSRLATALETVMRENPSGLADQERWLS